MGSRLAILPNTMAVRKGKVVHYWTWQELCWLTLNVQLRVCGLKPSTNHASFKIDWLQNVFKTIAPSTRSPLERRHT